jgi:hypothetical protein
LRETILFVFLSYLFWGLLIFILLAIGSNWSFIKISLSILLIISLIEFFPIWLSCKTAKFLPGLRNKISKIEQEKQFEEEKEKLSQKIQEKQKIWSNLYYCYCCDHVMDFDQQLYQSPENINKLIN